jgi:hypothetical protein
MTAPSESPQDRLWQEYSGIFREFDDLTLARWLAQTLGQLQGHACRMSHPLIGAYRIAAQVAHDRQIWLKRLATIPHGYTQAACCNAPLVPIFTRDILETGLGCPHCNGTAIAFDDLPAELQASIKKWADEYDPVHAVAHWEDQQRKASRNYEQAFEAAAKSAEGLLAQAGRELIPQLADVYPTVIWEDHDECLEVRPEDIEI